MASNSYNHPTGAEAYANDDTRSDTTEIIDSTYAQPSVSTPTASPNPSYVTETSTPNTARTDCSSGHLSTPEAPHRTITEGSRGRGLIFRRLNSDSPMAQPCTACSARVPSLIPSSPAQLSRAHSDSVDSKDGLPNFSLPAAARLTVKSKRHTDMNDHPSTPYKGQAPLPSSHSNVELSRPTNSAPTPSGSVASTLSLARLAVAGAPSTAPSPPRPVNPAHDTRSLRVDPPLSATHAASCFDSFSFNSPPRAVGTSTYMFSPSRLPSHSSRAMSTFALPPGGVPVPTEESVFNSSRSPFPASTGNPNSPHSETFHSPYSPAQSTCSQGSSCHSPHSTTSGTVLSPAVSSRKHGCVSVDAADMQRHTICRRHGCCTKCHRPLRRRGSSNMNSPSPRVLPSPMEHDAPLYPAANHQMPFLSHELFPIEQKLRHPSLGKPRPSNPAVAQPIPRQALPHGGSSASSPDPTGVELPEDVKVPLGRSHTTPLSHEPQHHHGHHHHKPMPPSPYPTAPASLAHMVPDIVLPQAVGSVRPVVLQAHIVSADYPHPVPVTLSTVGTPILSQVHRKGLAPLPESKAIAEAKAVAEAQAAAFIAMHHPPAMPTAPALPPAQVAPAFPSNSSNDLGIGMEDTELVGLLSRIRNFRPCGQDE